MVLQIGRLQQKQAEAAKAVEQLSQDTDVARSALVQALQNGGEPCLIDSTQLYVAAHMRVNASSSAGS